MESEPRKMTLMFVCETGSVQPDGSIRWFDRYKRPDCTENRSRILKRDAAYPTGSDGWKIVPSGQYVQRYYWNDIRAYGSTAQAADEAEEVIDDNQIDVDKSAPRKEPT
ncbi:MAG: hypothetical protein WA988_20945 [Candidatus Nanopelagicales bacterium]|jgi:hypothetical protein